MRRIKTYIAMAVTGLMMLTFVGCNAVERTEESIQKTVYAKVGDVKITKADVDKVLITYLNYYKQQYGDDYENNESLKSQLKEMRTQVLEGLIDNQVLLQSAKELGVNPTEDEIKAKVDDMIAYYKEALGSEEAYTSWLKENGYDENTIVDFLKERTIISMAQEAIVKDIEVSDEEVEAYYKDNIANYTTKAGADVTHLLFAPEKGSDGNVVEGGDEAAKARAEKARQLALSGQKLEDISKSDEFKSYSKFENLGHQPYDNTQLVPEFVEGFKGLKANEVSPIVKTSFGYHIIVNTAVYPEDVVQPLNDDLKAKIKSDLLSKKQEEAYKNKIAELKEKIKIKTYEDKI